MYHSHKMLANINYRGIVSHGLEHLKFRMSSPQMAIVKCDLADDVGQVTIVTFKSGRCRLMGCRKRLNVHSVEISINDDDGDAANNRKALKIEILSIMSATATSFLENMVTLKSLGDFCFRNGITFIYEPEIFPALRLTSFNPLCVNVFGSGRCVILGIRNLYAVDNIITAVQSIINRSSSCCQTSVNT
jgi:TATA-box binding protein (TBP) (component of TFIID and TFIIIB)